MCVCVCLCLCAYIYIYIYIYMLTYITKNDIKQRTNCNTSNSLCRAALDNIHTQVGAHRNVTSVIDCYDWITIFILPSQVSLKREFATIFMLGFHVRIRLTAHKSLPYVCLLLLDICSRDRTILLPGESDRLCVCVLVFEFYRPQRTEQIFVCLLLFI